MTGQELLNKIIAEINPDNYYGPLDDEYYVCSLEWLKEFIDFFQNVVVTKTIKNTFDCDDFAMEFRHYATLSMINSLRVYGKGNPVMFGVVSLGLNNKLGIPLANPGVLEQHALNLILTNDGFYWYEATQQKLFKNDANDNLDYFNNVNFVLF
jgi:hypothetical protein